MLAVVDTGPLYAAADIDDADHLRCLEVLQIPGLRLVIPTLVVAEVTYLIGSRLGAKGEATFLRSLQRCEVEPPQRDDWRRIAHLVEQYANFPLSAIDASVIALAERLKTTTVITLDYRHFAAVRPKHCRVFTIYPEP